MSLSNFLKIVIKHWKLLLIVPLIASIVVFWFMGSRPKEYRSSLLIYTGFGSGFSLSDNNDKGNFDYYAVNNEFDNLINTIKSDYVLTNVGLTLFAQGLIYGSQGNTSYITPKSYETLIKIVPEQVKQLIDTSSVEKSVEALEKYMDSGTENFVYELIHLYHPHYSIWALEKIEVKKIGSSDLIQVGYKCDDPAICYQTLKIIGDSFIESYKTLRYSESLDIATYFEEQLTMSATKLKISEDSFMDFSKKNRIINYYEQTKSIAGQLQSFELDYDKILTINAQAKKSTEALGRKIDMNLRLRLESGDVLGRRAAIASKVAKQATSSVFVNDSLYSGINIETFDREVVNAKSQLQAMIDTMDIQRQTPEGVERESILNQWLENTIMADATDAALKVLDGRRNEIDQKFDFYAPVGATVKRKEREININEQEYLSLLRSLSLAKLRQQDISMASSSLRVVDDPVFPISAEPSKRKLFSLATFITVLLLILIIMVVIELTDRTMRNAVIARRLSGLDVAAVFPMVGSAESCRVVDLEVISTEELASQIMQLRGVTPLPFYISIISMEPREGKSFISGILAGRFAMMGYEVQHLNYESDFSVNSKTYGEALHPEDLSTHAERSDIYITELPPAMLNVLPVELLRNSTLNLVVCRANRAWHQADTRMSALLSKNAANPLYIILNGVESDNMEEFTGELPKKRSWFRRFVKRITTREFLSGSAFK